MSDWDKDEFMSAWDKKYVSTNVRKGSKPYNKEFFIGLNFDLVSSQPELKDVAYAILAAACCAVGRADVVGRFFDDITVSSTPEESEQIFLRLREAITIIFPYLGMPTCIPACYGMVGVVQRKGQEYASTKVLRKATIDQNDVQKGHELRTKIYKGVGNSDIFALMDKYFCDLFTTSTVVTWGYLIAKANEEVFQPQESHLIVATAIMALGATRQTRSHIKATLGIGNSVACVKAVVGTSIGRRVPTVTEHFALLFSFTGFTPRSQYRNHRALGLPDLNADNYRNSHPSGPRAVWTEMGKRHVLFDAWLDRGVSIQCIKDICCEFLGQPYPRILGDIDTKVEFLDEGAFNRVYGFGAIAKVKTSSDAQLETGIVKTFQRFKYLFRV